MNILFKIAFIFFIFYYLKTSQETFMVVGYNNPTVPKYKILNIYDQETKLLDEQFLKVSLDNVFNTNSLILFNSSLPFPFTEYFQKFILRFLKTIPRINSHKITLGDFNNIYYKDLNNNRTFILNVNIQDSTQFTSRNIKVKILLNNISFFINPINNNLNTFDIKLLDKYLYITGIILDKHDYADLSINGMDNYLNLYQIDNQLHLMDPFTTSGSDMIITQLMKDNFEKSLKNHQLNNSKAPNSVGSN